MFTKDNLGLTFFDRIKLRLLLKRVLTNKTKYDIL